MSIDIMRNSCLRLQVSLFTF